MKKNDFLRELVSFCLLCLFTFSSMGCPTALAASFFQSAKGGPATNLPAEFLPSWQAGVNKSRIKAFVEGPAQQVPVEDRIAVFDNDGTLWAERPNYFQEDYIENRLGQIETDIPEVLAEGLSAIDTPMTVGDYRASVHDFLNTQKVQHGEQGSDFEVPYLQLTYKPMIELVQYLQANDFSVYICSGGGIDFVRAFSEEAYGIPTQNVIGSAVIESYDRDARQVMRTSGTPLPDVGAGEMPSKEEIADAVEAYTGLDYVDGGYPTPPEVLKPFVVNPFNDHEGKAIGIERYLGKKPIMAVGNSNGDFFMFDYTDSNSNLNGDGIANLENEQPLIVLLNHDDGCETGGFDESCEYEYNNVAEDNFCTEAGEYCSLAVAKERDNWLIVSMKNDFKTIFAPFNS